MASGAPSLKARGTGHATERLDDVGMRRVAGPGRAASAFRRQREVGNDVRALRRVGNRDVHLLSRNERFGSRKPFVERLRAPDDLRILQRARIRVARRATGLASEQALVGGAGGGIFDGVAGRTARLVQGFAMLYIRRDRDAAKRDR